MRPKFVRPFSSSSKRSAAHAPPRLDFRAIDSKWQQRWASQPKPAKQAVPSGKSYILPMFAYPSGSLHMGHLRVYTISDVIARYRRMRGDEVLHPTGWDAFGLPAENAAIEHGIDPAVWTEENIAKMKKQLKSMNTSFDWDAEISTCSPSFYKHTQNLFLKLYHRGLAYQAEALVNYDPVDKTVLANEQVDNHGRSWRSGALVRQINLRQWFFRITEYKEALLRDLDYLSEGAKWPERVILQQRNWIGRSVGARIRFGLRDQTGKSVPVHIFTTRPDTLFGVKYIALSMSHPLVQQMATGSPELQRFLSMRASFAPDSKEGFELPLQAVSPLSQMLDSNQEPIPVFTAPYVLEDYGEGAVMGVPGHDSRDLSFWKLHRPLEPISVVVAPSATDASTIDIPAADVKDAYTSYGILTPACGPYSGLASSDAGANIVNDLRTVGLAEPFETWRLRDWLVSRQRYWGTPIPIIHCRNCGTVPVPEQDLPVVLPKLDSSIKGQTGNPLDKIDDWINCTCPRCNGIAKRETDTMDTFVDSSWYFMRFPDSTNSVEPFSRQSAAAMLPVDTYVGGVEHAILHLLYARFIYKFLCNEGLVSGETSNEEPFQRFVAQGMVHGKTFSDPDTGRFLRPHEVEHDGELAVIKSTGKSPTATWEKMSKSKHNGVDPSAAIEKFGADALRAHILFAAPVSEILQWDEEKIIGIQRWFHRVHRLVSDLAAEAPGREVASPEGGIPDLGNVMDDDVDALLLTQTTSKNISRTFSDDIYSLNTAVSDLIKLTNGLHDIGVKNLTPSVADHTITALLKMMAPITPAFAEECWEELMTKNDATSIFNTPWNGDIITAEQESALRSRKKSMTCAVQVNGKLRFTTQVPSAGPEGKTGSNKAAREEEILGAVLNTDEGRMWLTERNDWEKRKRVVVVGGGKVLNVVF
ncbi:leucine-tRNA ligase [Rhinocladiella mackenziei CBS 650.93]|uniref:leucine--tRNA ligase n=1 Tax=Rhinocladiella mackenziei CBS 650.93 TaxID=1442369 RepID=A0A0D2FW71_9EURO|nr:leucine-tRNA ligase [Rhinocladiella mackenziei CBS 650.93]KIX06412.1 leucine-tRNA ligase [Rhinocladiella mackenziei CBS 650.93]